MIPGKSGVAAMPAPHEFSMRDLVAPLFRRRAVLIGVGIVTTALVMAAGFILPRPYKSRMSILVTRERMDPVITADGSTQTLISNAQEVPLEEINSESELLRSQDLMDKVVVATGLYRTRSPLGWLLPAHTPAQRVQKAGEHLAKKLVITNPSNSNLIEVDYSSSDPKLAHRVLQTLGRFYIEKHAVVHRPPGSYEFFAQQTEKYHQALLEAEGRLRDFSKQQDIAAPGAVQSAMATQLISSTGQLYSSRQQIAQDEQRIRSDEAQLHQTSRTSTAMVASAQADRLLEDLGTSLVAAQLKRTQLIAKYADDYPLVQEANREIASIEESIGKAERARYVTQSTTIDPDWELLREDLTKSRTDLAAQQAGALALAHGIDSMRTQLVNLEQQSLVEGNLERDYRTDESNYLLYLQKREQARIADALDRTRIGNVAIAVPASIPALPIYSSALIILIAFAAGTTLGIGSAYVVDYLDSALQSPAQVTRLLGTPVVSISKRTA